jgi:hypothetical protein
VPRCGPLTMRRRIAAPVISSRRSAILARLPRSRGIRVLFAGALAEVVRGRDAMAVPGSWAAMVHAVRDLGRPGIASMAIAAVDTALWDLKARLLDPPLVTLLGAARDRVPVYGSGGSPPTRPRVLHSGAIPVWCRSRSVARSARRSCSQSPCPSITSVVACDRPRPRGEPSG